MGRRAHSKTWNKPIGNSIDRFGFTNPVLIDDDGGTNADGWGRDLGSTAAWRDGQVAYARRDRIRQVPEIAQQNDSLSARLGVRQVRGGPGRIRTCNQTVMSRQL